MKNLTPIKSYNQKILGFLEETDNYIIARDYYIKILGRYDKKADCTRDYYGRVLTQGNTVSGLIFNPEYNKSLK